MSYQPPEAVVRELIHSGCHKAELPVRDILLRGFLSGAYLGFATVLAYVAALQTRLGVVGALVFPVGFVMIILLKLELVTGNFATIPMAGMNGSVRTDQLLRNWSCAFLGNLAGSVVFAVLYAVVATKGWHAYHTDIIDKIATVATEKTLAYKDLGATGLLLVLVKAILCNWMVTMGVVMGATSSSTSGKILAMWLPIFLFFALGLEHCVVNMFVISAAILMGAPIGVGDWWLWNQIPATVGNAIGGAVFTGWILYATYGRHQDRKKHAGA